MLVAASAGARAVSAAVKRQDRRQDRIGLLVVPTRDIIDAKKKKKSSYVVTETGENVSPACLAASAALGQD